ncbi:hypothetical protein RJ639_009952 [Escallonia herrerae]|uniref:Transcription elongation factor n=1 Tax=Escallonia herrerae TaxID=1293975 RepID=A0AA88VT48_9ASTE|nr:hypothetical protein RJ639_009952 [Escallonia herrerae]
MEAELIELFEAVRKAADAAAADGVADSSPEEDRCLDALKRLNKFPVTYQLLVSTQIGKRVRQLTKHPRKKIQSMAAQLIEIWKNILIEQTGKSKKHGSLDNKVPVKPEPVGGETSEVKRVQRVNSMKVSKVETMKVENNEHAGASKSQRVIKSETFSMEKKNENVKTEKNASGERMKVETVIKEEKQNCDVRKPMSTSIAPPKLGSVIYCKDGMRDKIRELLSEALCKVLKEADEESRTEVEACDPFRVAISLESALFEKWGRSNGSQKFKYRSIMFNIKDPQNPDFRRKVLLGHVKPEEVLRMTPEEMASTERQMQNVKIKEKALFDCERAAAPKATTNEFKCGRCGKKQCTYYQLQTRSADEPMTTFVTCVNCNNHWKFC